MNLQRLLKIIRKIPMNNLQVSINNVLQFPKQNVYVKNDTFWDCNICADKLSKYTRKPKDHKTLVSFHCDGCADLFHSAVFENKGIFGDEGYGIICSEKSH